jgi:hypothetical protein
MHRDFERDDPRRRRSPDDDPRDDPRERYGNEEDPWSREYRRAYAEGDFPRRMQDDRPYNRPGYEPEAGRPGGRENVDAGRGRRVSQDRQYDARYAGDPYGYDWERPAGPRGRIERYGQPAYGHAASPYDEGDVSSWYGGDTGMGDPGSSQRGAPSSREQYGSAPGDRFWSQYGRQFAGPGDRPGRQDARFGAGSGQAGGRFSGHGPRGYQRSDERICEDACELLTRHGEIDAREMDVEVHSATVILRGTVDSGRTRRLAEELIEDIPGVRDVQNELRVNRQSAYRPADSQTMVDSGTFASDRGGIRESGVPAYGVGVASTSGVSTRSGPGEPGISAGAGPSQHGNRWQIRETMDVVGSDGAPVGTVKSVHGTDFHVDRQMERDLLVPFSAVRTVDGERVMLSVRATEVDDQRWPAPGLAGSNEGSSSR